MNPLVVGGIVLAILIIILYVPIGIGAKYENGTFILFKIAFFSFNVPLNKVLKRVSGKANNKNDKKSTEKKPDEAIDKGIVGIDFILSLFGDFRRFVRKRIKLIQFELKITFGTADAASTAVYSGHLWSLSYNLLALVDRIIYVKDPKVNIVPIFNDATFAINASGIIQTRLAHIIATAFVFVYKFLKYKNKIRRTTK